MALIQINADLSRSAVAQERAASALERIAAVLERISPPVDIPPEPSGAEDFQTISYEGLSKEEDNVWTDYGPRQNY